jgi:hypothetical protein
MLIDIDFESLNQPAPGVYASRLEVFGPSESALRAWLYSYTRVGDATPCACDLVVKSTPTGLFVRDFERKADGWWRDSDGNVAESLEALLPEEVRALRLEESVKLQSIEVKA